jgi:hypothetical protein
MDMDRARSMARLIKRKRELEQERREVMDEIAKIEMPLLEEMQMEQLSSLPITVDGEKITIYIHNQVWAKAKDGDKDAVTKVLKRCGLKDYVSETYNTNSLSAYVRERIADGRTLQPTLRDVIEISEVPSIRGRRTAVSEESSSSKTIAAINNSRS